MKRSEEAALKAYPAHDGASEQWKKAHLSSLTEYIQGYEQAEKDLALTPEDIRLITKIHYEIVFKDTTGIKVDDVATEVLKRFNEQRKK